MLADSLIYLKIPELLFSNINVTLESFFAKNLKERGSLNAVFSFVNTAHQVSLIIIRVFQI